MAPYLLFGFLMAGLLSVLISAERVERHLGRRGIWSVIKAAAFGVPLPLCSCGVIPVSASLRRHGASEGATASFLISTPQTGVDSILVTYSLLGPVLAIFRPLAALLSGVLGGMAVDLTGPRAGQDAPAEQRTCHEECCQGPAGHGVAAHLKHLLHYGFVTLPRDIGRSMLIGLVLAALITALIPKGYFAEYVPPGIGQVALLMAAGVPVYVCATASVPVAAGLMAIGASPGAAFAFLMTGPATNAATLATLWKVTGRRTTAIYLGTMLVAALGGGLLLDALVFQLDVGVGRGQAWMPPAWVGIGSAVTLLGVLGYALVTARRADHDRHEAADASAAPQQETLAVKGMTCSHCAETVRRALAECPGVQEVQVTLDDGRATIRGENMDPGRLRKAVEEVGYSAGEPA